MHAPLILFRKEISIPRLQRRRLRVVPPFKEPRVKYNNCLSTRTGRCCPKCGEEFILVEPTDVLAQRPVQVDVVCPDCHFPGRASLTDEQGLRTVHPSPPATEKELDFGEEPGVAESTDDPLSRTQRRRGDDFDEGLPLDLLN